MTFLKTVSLATIGMILAAIGYTALSLSQPINPSSTQRLSEIFIVPGAIAAALGTVLISRLTHYHPASETKIDKALDSTLRILLVAASLIIVHLSQSTLGPFADENINVGLSVSEYAQYLLLMIIVVFVLSAALLAVTNLLAKSFGPSKEPFNTTEEDTKVASSSPATTIKTTRIIALVSVIVLVHLQQKAKKKDNTQYYFRKS